MPDDAVPFAGNEPDGPPVCSAKGCRAEAVHLLVWNNPRLHTADREKTWVACESHRQSLSQFLSARGFLRRVERLGAPGPPGPAGPAS